MKEQTQPAAITRIAGRILRASSADVSSADQAQQVLVVRVESSAGLAGHADCVHAPVAALAFLESDATSAQTRGVIDVVTGRDPADVLAIVADLHLGNLSNARGGIALAVIAAVEVAIWDLRAQLENRSLCNLLWGDQIDPAPRGYGTVYTGPSSYSEALERLDQALEVVLEQGFDAIKVEPVDECVPAGRIGEYVAAARRRIGSDRELLVDVYHRFTQSNDVWALAEQLAPARPFLIETPMPLDDLDGYRALRGLPVAVAGCELYERACDFALMLRYGHLDIVQPWPTRLGIAATLDVVNAANAHGAAIVLAGWNATLLGRTVNQHIAAGLSGSIVAEIRPSTLYPMLPLTSADASAVSDLAPLNERPGLGVDVDWEQPALLKSRT